MPSYNTSGFAAPPKLLTAGWPEYLYGKFPTDVSPTRMTISQVAIASNVATLTVQIVEGNLPSVGSLISVQGTVSDSGAANVSSVALTAVSINATSGAGTVTYAATGTNQSATSDSGSAIVPQPIQFDTLANGRSIPCAPPANDPNTDGARTFTAQVIFGSLPTACTVTLQGSLVDQNADYYSLGTVATVAGGAVTQQGVQFTLTNERFLRFNVSGVTGGTSPTIAAAILG